MNLVLLSSISLGEDEMHQTYHLFENNSKMDKNEKEANLATNIKDLMGEDIAYRCFNEFQCIHSDFEAAGFKYQVCIEGIFFACRTLLYNSCPRTTKTK